MKQLKVLVFSASFGNGHLRAAEAVIEGIRIQEPSATIAHLDFGDFLSKPINSMIKSVYGEIINHIPKLWGRFYYKTSMVQPRSISQQFLNKLGRNDFLKYIKTFKPDFIVCTYPTVSSVLAQLRSEKILQIPVVTIITDYTVHSHWVHPGVDRYIVACGEVKNSLQAWGIKAECIHVTGIPVSPKFEETVNRELILSKLGLKSGIPTFLVMGGSYGILKSANRICQKLVDSKVPVQAIIVCGKNEKLYESLKELSAQGCNPLVRLKYVHNVEELMAVSDLIITKAGGLTVSEALTKRLPLLIFKPIPGQEEENAHFVQKIGAGIVAQTEEEVSQLINYFLTYPEEVQKMRDKTATALPGHSTKCAVGEMLRLVKKEMLA
ncbi:UDP-N-acetylglucosamine--LPS N-acetylglucosamine transferase [Desulfosporosinus meridiei]|uniref:UDP-N-acetylglucosamine:LPS N-acetylglucosamine transferase n=1 Tax=Desulfosporosinus meridiei (strain ATCC BAA-275 / DSM 13257 / KCTC 12902 / NCIMB 13706 / S10) TaxID=768704 RepID=J7IXD1_DESMD|nr:UDP-N-acetylglucosamine--LPS N-acetylglucosamine transferase [Desulfosporosinus meridiei]AFQ46400.1 UDP-N-acetylglucosamine:LPS N-acetylglucosamine transferase [Desulfosporosinus meridiei DSM 13257]